jgi:hypothetical protein
MNVESLWYQPFITRLKETHGLCGRIRPYSINRRTWWWAQNLFFYPTDITVLKSFIPVTSCDSKLAQRIFGCGSVTIMILEEGREPQPQTTTRERETFSDLTWRKTLQKLALKRKRIRCKFPRRINKRGQISGVKNAMSCCVSVLVSRSVTRSYVNNAVWGCMSVLVWNPITHT